MHRKPVRLAIIFIIAPAVLWFLNSLVVPQTITYLKTRHLKEVFSEQVSLLSSPIASLGIQGNPSTKYQCVGDQGTNHLITRTLCQNFKDYPYSSKPGLPPGFQTHALSLDKLLQANGWINDSPKNDRVNITSISSANSATYDEISVPFHKNIGPISCNLDITFETLTTSLTTSTGGLNINEFACSENIAYPEINLFVRSYQGV